MICVEMRHMRAVLKQINKEIRPQRCAWMVYDAGGIFCPVHVKTLRSQKL